MTKLQRIRNSIYGAAMMVVAILLTVFPKDAYGAVIVLLALSLLVSSIASLLYYFTMARFMVGGKMVLYRGVIILDFAIFTGTLVDVPRAYILIYLAVIHLFSGLVEILRSRETRGTGGRGWRLKLFHGLLNVAVSVSCIVFARKTNAAVYIYCAGIFYSGLIRLIQSFRKTTFAYIR